jgi:tRNA-Thr(GGU) m(6)t(6)A37 methyltransferase TsaA
MSARRECRPIGVIRTPFARGKGTPIQGALAPDAEGTVEIDPELADGLADLAGFSHLHLLYLFDRTEGYRLRLVPFVDTAERGLFATRAPRRPNPIGMTVVRLLAVEGNTLRVAGVDMIDGTPLLDIKPYLPEVDAFPDARGGWFEEARRRTAEDDPPTADDRFE